MPRLLMTDEAFQKLLRRRRVWGVDRRDEVWSGTYVMSPEADNEHQLLVTELAAALIQALSASPGCKVVAGVNVSDQAESWTKNYRCPDVAVFLPGNPAEDRRTHWHGGPDFAVEVISKGDRARKKLEFYARVGVKELLLLDRAPWRLELYRLDGGALLPVGLSGPTTSGPAIECSVLPVSFRLVPAEPRPRFEVLQTADGRAWTI